MDIFQTITLSLIQGLTEFLPISSSAHLVLLPKLFAWPDQGLAFDVVLHFGTLCAIIYYYRNSLMVMTHDLFSSIQTRKNGRRGVACLGCFVGNNPSRIGRTFFKDSIELNLRTLEVIAFATLFFGLLLGFSDWLNRFLDRSREIIRGSDILIIGCFQALALIPGTSRSGITITAALLIGLSRSLSIKFSFLLSIPVIAIAMIVKTFDLANQVNNVDWLLLLLGFIISAITAYATIVFFIRLVERIGLLPFVIYRLLLGALLLTI